MTQQSEPRVTVDLPVRVWGMSAEGRPFSQHARAQNISSEGALLAGIENELKVGDVIGVQCEEKKTRCTVIWVMNTGPIKKNQVGVKLVAAQECPWKAYLPIEGKSVAVLSGNKRRWPRHKISFPIELRDGTVLRVDFYLRDEHITITAVVRTCDPGVGNGIEFTGMPNERKEQLQAYLDSVDPQKVSTPKPAE